jgi:5-methylcytosine-specific restriction endonuclease McrA
LCGGQCSWDDVVDGNAGDSYPSIDHVRPLSKGGTHEWNNVKLAHRKCNWEKRDS